MVVARCSEVRDCRSVGVSCVKFSSGGGNGQGQIRFGAIVSDLCEWYGWTVDYVLAAPFAQMMTMYDYGCEKKYGRSIRARAQLTQEKIINMYDSIAAAEARLRSA